MVTTPSKLKDAGHCWTFIALVTCLLSASFVERQPVFTATPSNLKDVTTHAGHLLP